jgi:hypothetical protein
MCTHEPPCPTADAPDREAARTIAGHPEQGWSLLCNGVVFFDDAGGLLPDGSAIAPPTAHVLCESHQLVDWDRTDRRILDTASFHR